MVLSFREAGTSPLHDPLGQPLGDGGLAHAGLADEHRVVLALAAQDTDDVADFVVPADDRIQLVGPGPLHQVGAVLLQGVVGSSGLSEVTRWLPRTLVRAWSTPSLLTL